MVVLIFPEPFQHARIIFSVIKINSDAAVFLLMERLVGVLTVAGATNINLAVPILPGLERLYHVGFALIEIEPDAIVHRRVRSYLGYRRQMIINSNLDAVVSILQEWFNHPRVVLSRLSPQPA